MLESALPARLDETVLARLLSRREGIRSRYWSCQEGHPDAARGRVRPADRAASVSQIEENFARRLRNLSPEARRLLLVAAADPVGDPSLVWRAAQRLGIPESAADTVESEGLLEVGTRVVFRHPLVRSAVYRAATPGERRAVHHALAEATDPELDPDRRAWHRAQAAPKPDEGVAAELAESAARAQPRWTRSRRGIPGPSLRADTRRVEEI